MNHAKSAELFARNKRFIPGGMVSLNRKVEPEIAFVRGRGAYVWDADGNKYIDYHAAFAPFLLAWIFSGFLSMDDGRLLADEETLFRVLHTLDIPALTAHPWLRSSLIVALCLCGLAFSLSGMVLAWRRLPRKTI